MIKMGRKRKYNTEEERRAAKLETYKRCYQRHKEERQKKALERYEKNKKECNKKHSEWKENNKEYVAEYNAEWRKNNPDYDANYYQENREEIRVRQSEYRSSKKGRANSLVRAYKAADKKYNRGECTLTDDWIVDNVFNGQCCHYCGESDWTKLGVDRKDSSLPHTPDNCVPCCSACNKKKARYSYDEFMRQIGRIA